jgi:hypothetical protein
MFKTIFSTALTFQFDCGGFLELPARYWWAILDGSCYEHMAIGKNGGDGFQSSGEAKVLIFNWISVCIWDENLVVKAGA